MAHWSKIGPLSYGSQSMVHSPYSMVHGPWSIVVSYLYCGTPTILALLYHPSDFTPLMLPL